MLNTFHVVVPVAVHQVGHTATGSLRQVAGILLDDLVEGNALQDDDLFAVGREFKAFHLTVALRQLPAVRAVSLHRPYLTTADEGDGLVVQPCRVRLALLADTQLLIIAAVAVHHADDLTALVGLHAVVTYLVDHPLAVRRSLHSTDASHGP